MGTRLRPVGTIAAALAGASLAVVLVGGPYWLVVPGLLGAALPTVITRRGARRRRRAGRADLTPESRLSADPS